MFCLRHTSVENGKEGKAARTQKKTTKKSTPKNTAVRADPEISDGSTSEEAESKQRLPNKSVEQERSSSESELSGDEEF